MNKKYRWNDPKREVLLHVAAQYDRELKAEREYTDETPGIKKIHQQYLKKAQKQFQENSYCDARAILYQLADMNFLRQRPLSKKQGVFYRQKNDIRLDNYKICVKYKPLKKGELDKIKSGVCERVSAERSVNKACDEMAAQFGRTGLNLQKVLFDNHLVDQTTSGELRLRSDCRIDNVQPLHECIELRKAPAAVINEINEQRAQAACFYSAHRHDSPAMIRSSDGTGFGKSYSVIEEFLKDLNHGESLLNIVDPGFKTAV
ncbi:MAG: hypothetical protein JEZ12_03790 [Desulfobacterium sp.]|nr:hypothetical protein [Desulfobacterium sp.]